MRGLRQIVTECRGQQEIKTNGFLEKAETERKLLEDIKTRKLRYFGHYYDETELMPGEGNHAKMVPGKRKRGRPRTSWMDNIVYRMASLI